MESDLKTLSHIGLALWGDAHESERVCLEILTRVALLDLSPSAAIEHTLKCLYKEYFNNREGCPNMSEIRLEQPFFRMTPEERLVLVALHVGRWSYASVGRVLEKNKSAIPEIAWRARVSLSRGMHPTGSPRKSIQCPEYILDAPWTQKFLDEEMEHSEKMFIQNHLRVCRECFEALKRCRVCYYSIGNSLPKVQNEKILLEFLSVEYQRVQRLCNPLKQTFFSSLGSFAKESKTSWMLVMLMAFALIKLLRG